MAKNTDESSLGPFSLVNVSSFKMVLNPGLQNGHIRFKQVIITSSFRFGGFFLPKKIVESITYKYHTSSYVCIK